MAFPEYTPVPTRLVTLSEADDEEPRDASTTNVSLEQLADGIAWLDGDLVGDRVTVHHAGDAGAIATTHSTWSGAGTSFADGSPLIYAELPGCLLNDRLVISFCGNFTADNSGGADGFNRVRLYAIEDVGGVGALQSFNGYAAMYSTLAAGLVNFGGINVSARHNIINPGTARIAVQGARDDAGNILRLKGGWSIVVTRIRP